MMNFVVVVMKVNGRYLTFLLVKILTMIGSVVPDKFKQTLLVIGVKLKRNKRKKHVHDALCIEKCDISTQSNMRCLSVGRINRDISTIFIYTHTHTQPSHSI